MDGFVMSSEEHGSSRIHTKLIEAAGSDTRFYSFFVNRWNPCMPIAATDAVCIGKDESNWFGNRSSTDN